MHSLEVIKFLNNQKSNVMPGNRAQELTRSIGIREPLIVNGKTVNDVINQINEEKGNS